MEEFRVTLYHGTNKKLTEKLEKFCRKQDSQIFFFSGDLNDFAFAYKDKFIHAGPQDHDHFGHEIYVTHRQTWDRNSPVSPEFTE